MQFPGNIRANFDIMNTDKYRCKYLRFASVSHGVIWIKKLLVYCKIGCVCKAVVADKVFQDFQEMRKVKWVS
jgi:hypothetical protein